MMTLAMMKKKNSRTRNPLDPLKYDLHTQLAINPHANHKELEMTPSPLGISLMKIKTTKDIALRVFTLTSTMEIDLR